MDWVGLVQAGASVGYMLIALVGMVFVMRQVSQIARTIRSNTNERLTNEIFEILRFCAAYPGTYDYFFNGKPPPDKSDDALKCVTAMGTHFLQHVVLQKETLPKDAQKVWDRFVRDTYNTSPVIQQHLKTYGRYYHPSLLQLVASRHLASTMPFDQSAPPSGSVTVAPGAAAASS